MLGIIGIIGIIAAGIAAGLIIYSLIKLTVSGIIKLVNAYRNKDAKKTLIADINDLIGKVENKKSMDELIKIKDQGVTHLAAGVGADGNLVDKIQMIENEDDETAYEVVELLGDEGMVVIED